MKRYLSCLLFLLVLFASYEAQAKDVQAYLDETFRLYQQQHTNTAAIAKLLSEGLVEHPGDSRLLLSRGSLYCSRGMLSECRADTQALLALKQSVAQARMMLCMLDEFEGAAPQVYETCYRDVAELFAAGHAASAEQETANTLNSIFAMMMANHPDAEKEKAAFLSKTASDPKAWIYHGVLDAFDRKRALREIFGQ